MKIGILAKELDGWQVSADASSGTASNGRVESRAAFRRSGQAIFCRGKFQVEINEGSISTLQHN